MNHHHAQRALFILKGANLQLTTDQAFIKIGIFTNYRIVEIMVNATSGTASALTAGGVYTAGSKGGSAIVSALQSWATLSSAGVTLPLTLAGLVNTALRSETPILSLTVASSSAATADLFLIGYPLD